MSWTPDTILTPDTIKLLWSFKSRISKDKNGENVPCLEITEVVLVHCNIVNNNYQQNSRVLHTFDISLKNFIFLKSFDTDFSYIEVWFTDQSSNLQDIEVKINITLVIN